MQQLDSVGPGGSAGVALTATSTPVTCQYYCMIHATPTTGALRASITFQQSRDSVAMGSTVTFSCAPNSVSHNVTWDAGPTTPPNSATMSSGAYTTPALDAGTYTYHCTIHVPLGMQGTIVVR